MRILFIALTFFILSFKTYGQSTILKNSVDESLSFRSIASLPIVDNMSQIYAKPLTIQLEAIIDQDRQWAQKKLSSDINASPEDFEQRPEQVKSVLKKAGADLLLTTRISKGPNGISIKMCLLSGHDGLLIAQEVLQDYSGFEISDLRGQLQKLFQQLKSRMPYSGFILSRKGQSVTVNIGSNQNLSAGQDLSVIQILKINRHPKFKFIVSTEKEIIGRIHVDKSEDSLSFGTISLERSENVIQPNMKVVPVNFVQYPTVAKDSDGQVIPGLENRADGPLVLGKNPEEWEPRGQPTFGKVGIGLGIGSYAINNTLSTVGAVENSVNLTPSIHIDGELWLTTNWFMGLGLKQYIVKLDNTYPGSTPGKINVSTMQTTLQAGYNFLVEDQFFGPKFQGLIGYSKFSATVDTSSPTAYTSMDFSGLAIGVSGSFPVSTETPLTLGAKLMYYLSPTVSESPVSSGSSANARMTSFSAFGVYKVDDRMNIKGDILYDLYSASFSGAGSRAPSASSASHTMTTIVGGIEYMF